MIERGERSPTVDMLEKLAKALKIDPVAFLTAGTEKDQTIS